MAHDPKQDETYASAIIAERREDVAPETVTLHNVRPKTLYPSPDVPGKYFINGELYFWIFFRNPRPGAHTLRVVFRDRFWNVKAQIEFGPIEKARADEVEARSEPLQKYLLNDDRYYVCVQVDGVDRAVVPILNAKGWEPA